MVITHSGHSDHSSVAIRRIMDPPRKEGSLKGNEDAIDEAVTGYSQTQVREGSQPPGDRAGLLGGGRYCFGGVGRARDRGNLTKRSHFPVVGSGE